MKNKYKNKISLDDVFTEDEDEFDKRKWLRYKKLDKKRPSYHKARRGRNDWV